jgi:hypothetical protein
MALNDGSDVDAGRSPTWVISVSLQPKKRATPDARVHQHS